MRYYSSKFDAYATRLAARLWFGSRGTTESDLFFILSFAYRQTYVHTTYLGTLGILDRWRVGVSGRVSGVQ